MINNNQQICDDSFFHFIISDKEMDDPTDTVDGQEGSFDIDRKSTGLRLLLRQFWALIVKRFHHSRRNRKGFLSQIILPAFFVCLAMIVAQIRPFYEMPPIKLSTKMFQESEPYIHYLMFSKDDSKDQLAKNLSETFLNYPGIGRKSRLFPSLSTLCMCLGGLWVSEGENKEFFFCQGMILTLLTKVHNLCVLQGNRWRDMGYL